MTATAFSMKEMGGGTMDDKEFEETLASVKRDLERDEAMQRTRAAKQSQRQNPKGQTRPTKRRSVKKRRIKRNRLLAGVLAILAVLLIVMIVILVKGNLSGASLKGTWRIDDTTVYEFNDSGKGAMHTSLNSYDFTYTLENDKLYIDYTSDAATDTTYQYSIKGDTLTLERGGEIYTLKKDSR